MAQISFVLPDGTERQASHAGSGRTLLELARDNGIPGITGDCGGFMSCATCHLHVDEQWLGVVGPASETEREIIELTADPAETSRLGCQIWVSEALDGLRVHVAAH